jgi:hypothetical protein
VVTGPRVDVMCDDIVTLAVGAGHADACDTGPIRQHDRNVIDWPLVVAHVSQM